MLFGARASSYCMQSDVRLCAIVTRTHLRPRGARRNQAAPAQCAEGGSGRVISSTMSRSRRGTSAWRTTVSMRSPTPGW